MKIKLIILFFTLIFHTQGITPQVSPFYWWLNPQSATPYIFSADSEALFAAFTTPPTSVRKITIDKFIVRLTDSLNSTGANMTSLSDFFDYLYVMRSANEQAATLNWANPSRFVLTKSGSVTFVADSGFKGTGGYLITGCNLKDSTTNYTQNNNSFGVLMCVGGGASMIQSGAYDGSTGSLIYSSYASKFYASNNNSGQYVNVNISGKVTGMFGSSRLLSTLFYSILDGAYLDSLTNTAGAKPNRPMWLLAGNFSGSPNGISTGIMELAWGGKGLTSVQARMLWNCYNLYKIETQSEAWVIIADGNSITASGYDWIPYPTSAASYYGDLAKIYNTAISGYRYEQLLSNFTSSVRPKYQENAKDNLILCLEFTNQVQQGTSPEDMYNTLLTAYYDSCKAQGSNNKVIIMTGLPFHVSNPTNDSIFEARRIAFNNLMRSDFSNRGDYLLDIALDTNIGIKGKELIGTYYIDSVHLNTNGHLYLWNTYIRKLLDFLRFNE